MFKLMLWLTLVLVCILSIPITLIRAQPYDDSELRAFLTPPEGCPAPCFMGIRPGVTTADQAYSVLEAHNWTTDVNIGYFRDPGNKDATIPTQITWAWDEAQSRWIYENGFNLMSIVEGRVDSIVITTSKANIGELMLVLGYPDWVQVTSFNGNGGSNYGVGYLNSGILATTSSGCPLHDYDLAVPILRIAPVQMPDKIPTWATSC